MKLLIGCLLAIVILVSAVMFSKRVSPLGWGWWGEINSNSGIALNGFDPVSYFNESGPVPGSPDYKVDRHGVEWHFADSRNQQVFEADPERYLPQFGGFCAFAVGKGFTADVRPTAWHVEDGKLYVFADDRVRDKWVADLPVSLSRSRSRWADRQP